MSDYDVSEADYMEDGANYLEEYQCKPCEDCAKKSCSDFCMKYDEWFWNRQECGKWQLAMKFAGITRLKFQNVIVVMMRLTRICAG